MSNENNYYYSNGERIPLILVNNVIAVKHDESRANNDRTISREEENETRNFLFAIPKYGIEVYKNEPGERISALNEEIENIAATVPVFKLSTNDPNLMVADNKFIVQFKPDVTNDQIDKLNEENNVKIVKPLDYADNGYILQVDNTRNDPINIVQTANIYYESGLTIFSHPNFIRERHLMQTLETPWGEKQIYTENPTNDNFLSQQWHLEMAKVIEAWKITQGSPNIKIAIADDGVAIDHPEFQDKVVYQYDFEVNVPDGRPKHLNYHRCKPRFSEDPIDDCHGTACAGVATASGVKAYGAAPKCSLMAIRTPRYLGLEEEGEMFQKIADNGADIVSCSWGPGQLFGNPFYLADNVRAALKYCTTNGRNGKGTIVLFAAGNYAEDTSFNGYTANPYVMTIAASNSNEDPASYSNFGKEVWVCAPSSDYGAKRIFTTDIPGKDGYNQGNPQNGDSLGDYTNGFGGTSSSTPLVAGVIGLILSVNSSLTWQQVRDIIARTADKIGDLNTYRNTPLGKHSTAFGYGRINALKAVEEAQHIH